MGLLSRLAGIRNKRVALTSRSTRLSKDVLDRELDKLISNTLDIEPVAAWASQPAGEAFREEIAEKTAILLMQLPDAILEDPNTAQAMAALIKAYSNVLRIFNSPVLEYERVRQLVDKRLGSIGDDHA